MTRPILATLAAGAALALAVASPASAHWTPRSTVPHSAGATWPAIAVNGRGDVVVAWVGEESSGTGANRHTTVTVHVATRPAGATGFTERGVMRARDRAVGGLAVVLDRRGEATVAWVDEPGRLGALSGPRTVRAAWRPPGGTWSRAQAIGRSSAFYYAFPRLAAAPDRTVVLTYNAGIAAAPGVAAAWRSPGHGFGVLQSVPTGRGRYLMDPTLAFDAGNLASLAGTRNCDRPTSHGVLLRSSTKGRRFRTMRTIAPAPARSVRYVVTGRGDGAAVWLKGMCSTTEELAFPPAAATVTDGTIGTPVALSGLAATALELTSAPGGAAQASWTAFAADPPDGQLLESVIPASGAPSAASTPAGNWIAVAGDARGDQLVRQVEPTGTAASDPVAARPADGAAVEAAPIAAAGFPWAAGTTAAADGPALAIMSGATGRLVTAVWTP